MNERDKDIVDIRIERDDCAALLRRLLHATRDGQSFELLQASRLRERAQNYLKRKGLEGSPFR